jgi:hypothetical protein
MAKQTINVGTVADDDTGDTFRASFIKCNENFTELYTVPVVAVTTTVTPDDTNSGTIYTNEGDADGATVFLPTAAAGLKFILYVQTAQVLTVTAAAGDTIRIASNATAEAGSITSSVVGSSVTLVAINATEWVATSSVGSWSF